MKLKPKIFGPCVVNHEDREGLSYQVKSRDGTIVNVLSDSDELSPVDLMLMSVGACLNLSMKMARDELGINTGNTEFELVATKAVDAPSRIDRLDVGVRLEENLEKDELQRLLDRTKTLCTISQSIRAELTLTLATQGKQPPIY